MTPSSNHLDDEVLSAHIDSQLSPEEVTQVERHVASCADCRERLDALSAVASLLRHLPEVDPPRDFALGPRAVADPPNVIRLQRWYTATRAAAAALAAVFVLLSAGTLYIDSRPGAPTVTELARPQVSAPAAAPAAAASPAVAVRAAAPASNAQAPAAGAAAPRPAPAQPQPDDQVAAATSVRPLPTLPPTPAPTAAPVQAVAPLVELGERDSAAPVRIGAVVVGILAVVSLLVTLIVRHRLQRQLSHL